MTSAYGLWLSCCPASAVYSSIGTGWEGERGGEAGVVDRRL